MKNEHWIQGDNTCESPLFRRSFRLNSLPGTAVLDICGLGYFHLYVNGERISDQEFAPAMSNYSSLLGKDTTYPVWEERSCYRTYYLSFDLLPYLREGENVLGVQLGSGWYHQTRRKDEGDFTFSIPKLRYELKLNYHDGQSCFIESDSDSLWKAGEITQTNLFYGETHDLRLKQDDWSMPGADLSNWHRARPTHAPETCLEPQTCPPDRVLRSLTAECILRRENYAIYDAKENIAGRVLLKSKGKTGDIVRIRHSEILSEDQSRLDFGTSGGNGQIQENTYILRGEDDILFSKFTWQGFRFFDVSGPAEVLRVEEVCTDVKKTSDFQCSDPVLNWLYEAYIRSQIGNIHGSIPSDCPHRERLGYTGDGQLTAECAMLLLDTKAVYEKWYRDILDSQGADSGHIPHTAPFMGGGGGPGGWGSAVYIVPMKYYEIYGDTRLLEEGYEAIYKWLGYMRTRCDGHLVTREEEGGWCLGDWCTPEGAPMLPEPFVNTYYYIKGLRAFAEIAELLGRQLPAWIAEQEEHCREAWIVSYFNPATGDFCEGVAGANAFALDLNLGDQRTRSNLVSMYKAQGRLDTGIFGTPLIVGELFRAGEGELAVLMLNNDSKVSYKYMMDRGATTLWENWEGSGSHNHPMFGSVVKYLFAEVLGIRQEEGSSAYKHYRISPANIPSIQWARGSIDTVNGRIEAAWKRDPEGKILILR